MAILWKTFKAIDIQMARKIKVPVNTEESLAEQISNAS